jgi:nitroreductase
MEVTHAASGSGSASTRSLARAAAVAAQAPSIHNTQPWRWRIHDAVADLYADTSRLLRIADPDRRMLTISCGVALHHARVALAADGVAIDVDVVPSLDDPDHLARITVTGSVPVTAAALALSGMVEIRRTDRRPLLDEPLPAGVLDALRSAASVFGTGIYPLGRDDVLDLAAATDRAQRNILTDAASRTELDAWAGDDHRPAFAGIPIENIPNRTPPTIVPVRDFGHIGTLATAGGHDTFATYAILYGFDDRAGSWLRAGEALSAVWLAATERDIALLPLSAAVEQPTTREMLSRMLAGVGYPAIGIRLGVPNPNQPAAPRTPRLPAAATVEMG